MSAILDKLLKGQNVEWKTLDEIAIKISSGGTPRTGVADYYDGDIPWLRTQEINFDEIWDTGVKITTEGLQNSSAKMIPENCVIIAMYGATVGKVGINKIPMATNQACANIQLNEDLANYRYVFHFLMSKYQFIKSLGTGSQTNINAQIVKNLEIPIPPLDVQAEIVRILDAFTAVTAELNMREKQYQYYRDKFLSFSSDEINWKILGELGQLIRGNGLQKSDFTEDGFPAIHYGQIYTFYGTFADKTKSFVSENLAKKLKKAQNGDVLLAGTSENIQDVMKPLGWLGNEIAISGDMFAYRPNTELDTKYLTYLLQTTEFQKYKEKYAHGTKVTRLNAEKFLRFEIAIPPLNEQKRIANILDKFETLTHSITEGLPKEITLREQQYEYYREQLIDFPKN